MKNLDFLYYQPSMFINNSEFFKTNLGGAFSILLFVCTALCIYAFGKDFYFRTNPSVLSSELYDNNLELKQNQTFLAFACGLNGGLDVPDRSSYYRWKFGKVVAVNNGETSKVSYVYYNAVPCSEVAFWKENQLDITSNLVFQKDTYYCLPENVTDFNLARTFGAANATSYDIRLEVCQNSTTDQNCKDSNQIQSTLRNFFVQIVGKSNIADPSNLEEPLKPYIFTSLSRVSSYASRQDIFFFKIVEFFSDHAFLLPNESELLSFVYDKKESDSVSDNSPPYIYRSVVTLSNLKLRVNRIYTKLQKVAADVGGVIKFLLVVITLLNSVYACMSLNVHVSEYLAEKLKVKKNMGTINIREFEHSKSNNYILKTETTIKKVGLLKMKMDENIALKDQDYSTIVYVLKYYLCYVCKRKKDHKLTLIKSLIKKSYCLESIIDTQIILSNSLGKKAQIDSISKEDALRNHYLEYFSANLEDNHLTLIK